MLSVARVPADASSEDAISRVRKAAGPEAWTRAAAASSNVQRAIVLVNGINATRAAKADEDLPEGLREEEDEDEDEKEEDDEDREEGEGDDEDGEGEGEGFPPPPKAPGRRSKPVKDEAAALVAGFGMNSTTAHRAVSIVERALGPSPRSSARPGRATTITGHAGRGVPMTITTAPTEGPEAISFRYGVSYEATKAAMDMVDAAMGGKGAS